MIRQICRPQARVPQRIRQVRYYSETINYHPKVTAVPFALSPDQAARSVSVFASLLAGDLSGGLESIANTFLPWFFDFARPLKITPVYLPTWRFEAEVVAKAYFRRSDTDNSVETSATVHSLWTYYPGFSLFPISLINFHFEPLSTNLCSPADADFAVLHDSKEHITCLPYTRSPFSLPAAARALSFRDARINKDYRFEPTSARFPLIAPAYPVLFPVYLMQYEAKDMVENKTRSMSIVLEAHKADGLMYAEGLGDHFIQDRFLPELIKFGMGMVDHIPLDFSPTGSSGKGGTNIPQLGVYYGPVDRRSRLRVALSKVIGPSPADKALREWLEERMLRAELRLTASAAKSQQETINWDDPRVRQLNTVESTANSTYWDNRMRLTMTRKLLVDLKSATGAVISVTGDPNAKNGVGVEKMEGGDAHKFLEDEVVKQESRLEETKPEWLRVWERGLTGDEKP